MLRWYLRISRSATVPGRKRCGFSAHHSRTRALAQRTGSGLQLACISASHLLARTTKPPPSTEDTEARGQAAALATRRRQPAVAAGALTWCGCLRLHWGLALFAGRLAGRPLRGALLHPAAPTVLKGPAGCWLQAPSSKICSVSCSSQLRTGRACFVLAMVWLSRLYSRSRRARHGRELARHTTDRLCARDGRALWTKCTAAPARGRRRKDGCLTRCHAHW